MNQYNSYQKNKKNKHPISIKEFYPTDFLCLSQQFHLDILIIPSHSSYTIKFNHKIRQPVFSFEKRKTEVDVRGGGEKRGLFSFLLWFCEQWNDKKMENTQKKKEKKWKWKPREKYKWLTSLDGSDVCGVKRDRMNFHAWNFREYFRISSCFFASRPVELKIRARANKRRSTMIVLCHAFLSFLLRWQSKKIAFTPITTHLYLHYIMIQ